MKLLSFAVLLLFALSVAAQDANKNPNKSEPPILGPHWTHEAARAQPPATSPDMTYHGGPILPAVTVKAIWWGSSWPTYTGDEISGIDKWYSGVGTATNGGGSAYFATVNEYTDSSGQQVGTAITYQGHVVDGSSVPKRLSTSAVLAEVCKEVPNPVANAYYPVYIDKGRGHASYCAYHSWGSCGGKEIEFGFFFKLDGDAGCDPQSAVSGESQGLAAAANVTGHELSETRSDPNGNAWYDGSGNENGDKCAWTFGGPYVVFLDGTHWKIQGNWSNYDYDHNTGYANSSGQKGCADGTNYPGPYTK
ncbi:MAG TPA: hypothetical protein VGS05_08910 [Candidatus Sulfotelmatobacter sp.]|nr:hypothetical protein [Candidatus Sulfotelmatobacter sp.]